jgi:hypothetical protein
MGRPEFSLSLRAFLLAMSASMPAYSRAGRNRGVVRRVPEMPCVPGNGDAGLRAANVWLRDLLAERGARIAEQDAEIAVLREHLAGLQSQVADLAAAAGSP